MTELEIMERAKMYVDKLANGVNPITDQTVPDEDCINNVRISRCLFYVSGVLSQVIANGGVVKKVRSGKEDFSITEEQLKQFSFSTKPIPISEIAKRINALSSSPTMKALRYRVIASYLIEKGFLIEMESSDGKKRKIPTEKGKELGIISEEREGINGNIYYANVLNEEAQKFIIDNMKSILSPQGQVE